MTRVFINVVILAILLAVGAGVVFGIIARIGAASIVVPIATSITVGYMTIALVFARRAQVRVGGWSTKFSVNALALFLAAWIVLPAGLLIGGAAFRESIIAGIDPASTANAQLLGQIGPVAAAAIGVLMAFAKGDDDSDVEEAQEVVEEVDKPPTAS